MYGPARRPKNIITTCPIVSGRKYWVRDQPNSSSSGGAKAPETEVWTPTAMNCAMKAAATTTQP